MKIESINDAIDIFENAAIKHKLYSDDGNYKKANKEHEKIIKALNFLYNNKNMEQLLPLLNKTEESVKEWAATYLLPEYEDISLEVLRGIKTLTAETIVKEWEKGRLDLSLVYRSDNTSN